MRIATFEGQDERLRRQMAQLLVDAFREHWSAAWSTFDEGMEEIGEMLEAGIQMFDYQGRSCGWVHEYSNRRLPFVNPP
ncbi:MAG: hypothetical protein C4557_08115 [Anaerolineaceae bacterium]|jgi:polyhydroxyalkanoate synthesis regulator protein|nr:MAG: hypothetical protein C4557_08115 [Anaerolineaceae bacterium]